MDYSASTPVDEGVFDAMAPYFNKTFANPSSLHSFGQEASAAVFESRKSIAKALGADYREVVFTASATEANNLAIRGAVKAFIQVKKVRPKVITTVIEHESVLETCRDLEKDGVEVVYVPVDGFGLVDILKLESALDERTVIISVMHSNNEVGTIQPIAQIAALIKKNKKIGSPYPLFHTDAVQSFQYCDVRPGELGVDLLTLSAHKIYGPKGIGALYVKDLPKSRGILHPVITGSGQEQGLRSGTENVPYIVGFAKAVEISESMRSGEAKRLTNLRDYFWNELSAAIPDLKLNSSAGDRLPNIINIYFPGKKAHELLIALDLSGVSASPGAACRSGVAKASYVIAEMSLSAPRAEGSLRFSLGRQTAKADIDYAIRGIVSIVARKEK